MPNEKFGIILAGGTGSRLNPLTNSLNKQLLPVFDKPMIYYPLSTLMLAGIKNICLITNREFEHNYKKLLGDGQKFGVNIIHRVQEQPTGIPDAFKICEDLILDKEAWLILGDNIFVGEGFIERLTSNMSKSAQIFTLKTNNPNAFGVLDFDDFGKPRRIVEKPTEHISNVISVGLYRYRNNLSNNLKKIKKSARGETEISDLNNIYIDQNDLECNPLGRGMFWCDAGTPETLLDAANYVRSMQRVNNFLIGSPEEIALNKGWILPSELIDELETTGVKTPYSQYLHSLAIKISKTGTSNET